jgi:hypothetical protein
MIVYEDDEYRVVDSDEGHHTLYHKTTDDFFNVYWLQHSNPLSGSWNDVLGRLVESLSDLENAALEASEYD